MDRTLAERRAALLSRRLTEAGVPDGPARESITLREDRGTAPLSPAQWRTWRQHRADPSGAAYNVCLDLTLSGPLNVTALRTALGQLVGRHEVLRTRYPLDDDGGRPVQCIDPPSAAGLPVPLTDLRGDPPEVVDRRLTELAGHRFDLAGEWPLRAVLWRTGERDHRLGLVVHHIVWDGGSWAVISDDLSRFYAAADGRDVEAPPPLPVQYGDLAAARARTPSPAADREYWLGRLAGLPGPLPLPADRPGVATGGPAGGRRTVVLDEAETGRVSALAGSRGVTSFTVLLAAFGPALHRWSGAVDLPVGSGAMNRDRVEARPLVGNFGNTLVLRLDASGDPTFAELLARVDRVAGDGLDHQEMPYDEVVGALREAGEQHSDSVNVMLLFLGRGLAGPSLPDVRTDWRTVHNGTHQVDLAVEAFVVGPEMRIEATYSAALLSSTRVDELLGELRAVLAGVAAEPGTRLSELPVRTGGPASARSI
ncbi:MAG TPA: condensation domain-containing protein [Pseudonocardia sp.]|jgi:hypothetical protein